jgi:hypothetical protein
MQVATASQIDKLNAMARQETTSGREPYEALMDVVRSSQLTLVRGDRQSRVYSLPDGSLVNLWIDAPEANLGEGGLGFDDQVD